MDVLLNHGLNHLAAIPIYKHRCLAPLPQYLVLEFMWQIIFLVKTLHLPQW